MTDGIMNIVYSEATYALEGTKESIKDRLKIAMKCVKDHYLAPPDSIKMNAAVLAVMNSYGKDSKEYERLRKEMINIKFLNDYLTAKQAGLTVEFPNLYDDFKSCNIIQTWEEIKKGDTND